MFFNKTYWPLCLYTKVCIALSDQQIPVYTYWYLKPNTHENLHTFRILSQDDIHCFRMLFLQRGMRSCKRTSKLWGLSTLFCCNILKFKSRQRHPFIGSRRNIVLCIPQWWILIQAVPFTKILVTYMNNILACW